MNEREPSPDEIDGMNWWNSLTEAERAQALRDAGLHTGSYIVSAADCWALYKSSFTRLSPQFVRWIGRYFWEKPVIDDAWRDDADD